MLYERRVIPGYRFTLQPGGYDFNLKDVVEKKIVHAMPSDQLRYYYTTKYLLKHSIGSSPKTLTGDAIFNSLHIQASTTLESYARDLAVALGLFMRD